MKFADGTMFDVQEDETGQYLVLALRPDRSRPRCNVGDWIIQTQSGFQVVTDEVYRAMGGDPEE